GGVMHASFRWLLVCILMFNLLSITGAAAQERQGTIAGRVMDASQRVLPGARIELQPGGKVAVTDANGEFTISDLEPGRYAVRISREGFGLFSTEVTITADKPVRVEAALQIGTHNEVVTVSGERASGEVEALDIERTADNIVQVLPADVITSLPNTNIADAVGRLPSVSLERDEGEGKYIQIRGTEPRLSNVTINGIHVPSPEGVRNVKLDAIPADLVDSVEINKTLSANQDADAIGGSVNLVTKTAGERPYVTVLGMGGYTPIAGGRDLYQLAGTAGQRFGTDKKFGALFGFSYDYNARGIHDLEPGQAVNTLPDNSTFFGPNAEDLRDYHYDRSRYGFDGELDYKLAEMSSVYIRGLFSHFNDNGEDWIYSPAISNFTSCPSGPFSACGNGGVSYTDVFRTPTQQISSVQAGARHLFGGTVLTYEVALSHASYTGGFAFAGFGGPGSGAGSNGTNDVAFGVDTKDPFVPKLQPLSVNIYDPTTYTLGFADTEHDAIAERDIVGDISLNKQYSVGGHSSSFEVGFKGWDARKAALFDRENFTTANQALSDFLINYRDKNYYFGNFTYGPVSSFNAIQAALAPGGTKPNTVFNLRNDFDIRERIWAGYAMNTISFGQLRIQAGVRIESTNDSLVANKLTFDPSSGNFTGATPRSSSNGYIDVFPSVQAAYRFGSDTILRAAYGAGIARPNFGDLAPFLTDNPLSNPEFSAGNPNLKPTHAQNFDLLAERYLKRVGIIQGGFFYKALTDPIYGSTVPFQGKTEATLLNGPSAHLAGLEATWQQRLSFLPGALKGMGVRANYSYVTSRATFPAGGRTDHPTLQRTAPNNWNLDATYDRKGISARMGLSHNDGYIWSYGVDNSKTPNGDTYLYPHTQVDAQVSYWIPRGHGLQIIVSGLNLNNEVFGFYNGAEQYPIQREYYSRTISAGLRWTPFTKETH
ncbi:MAG TPA: TonB-dependent receptor, partial [Terriglobales bacterium]|nr:TonB-dependent receptor [Terriglobales bacterium]